MNVSTFPTPCLPDEMTTDDAFARETLLVGKERDADDNYRYRVGDL